MPFTDLQEGNLAVIKSSARSIEASLAAYYVAVEVALDVARHTLHSYLTNLPGEVHTCELSTIDCHRIAKVWAAQYAFKNSDFSVRLHAHVDSLLEGSGWIVVMSETSDPNPRNEHEMERPIKITLRRIQVRHTDQ